MPSAEDWDLGFSNVVYVRTKASNDPTPGETVFVTPNVTRHIEVQSEEASNGYSPSQNYTHYQGTNAVTINLQPTSPTSPSVLSRTPPLPSLRTRRPPLSQTRSISYREHESNNHRLPPPYSNDMPRPAPAYSTYRIIRPSFSWNTTTNIPTSRSNSLPPLVTSSPRGSFSSNEQLSSTFGSRLYQPRRSVVGGTYGAGVPSSLTSHRYSCDYGKSSYMPTNVSSPGVSSVIHSVKVPPSYYNNGNISTSRRSSFSRPTGLENGDILSLRRPSFSRPPSVERGDILTLRRPSFSRPVGTSSSTFSPSLSRRGSVESRPQSSAGYHHGSAPSQEMQSRASESRDSLRNRTQQAKEKIKYHQQLMDRYLPANNGPVGDVRYDVEYKFVELADRMPEFEAYRSPSRRGSVSRSGAQSRAGSRERTPYIPPQTASGTPKVSEARQKIRQILRSTSVNKDYNF